MCYSALENLLFLVAQVHGNRLGQANESLKTAPFFKGFRNKSRFTKRRKLYRMLPICEKANRIYGVIQLLRKSQRHIIIKSQRYKFLYCATVVFTEKLIKYFNSYLRAIVFFYLPFANNEKNPASSLDIWPHVFVVAECEHPPHILIYSHYVQISPEI